jgi:hypothetical protein
MSILPSTKFDGFVKNPSAALRFTPQFSRALHLELFTKPYVWVTFYAIINFDGEDYGLESLFPLGGFVGSDFHGL